MKPISYILRVLAALLGAFLLLFASTLIADSIDPDVLTLDRVVVLIIYALFIWEFIFPNIKSNKKIAALGIRWRTTIIYSFFALAAIVLFYIFEVQFNIQLIVQGALFFYLIVGYSFAFLSSHKVGEIAEKEKVVLNQRDSIRVVLSRLQDTIIDNALLVSPETSNRIDTLVQRAKYISPSDSEEAINLDEQFKSVIGQITEILETKQSEDNLNALFNIADRIIEKRKKIYNT